jgi:hypothetical protein
MGWAGRFAWIATAAAIREMMMYATELMISHLKVVGVD